MFMLGLIHDLQGGDVELDPLFIRVICEVMVSMMDSLHSGSETLYNILHPFPLPVYSQFLPFIF